MTTIYLTRHGEVFNPKGILYGRLPRYKLSDHGRKQIEQTAAFLKDKKVEAVYASPLMRAQQTAEILCDNLKLHRNYMSKSLLEVNTSFQGTPFAKLSPSCEELYISEKRLKTDETIEQLAQRYHKFFERLSALHPDETFAAVGHGDPIMAFRAFVNNMPLTLPSIRTNKHYAYIKHGEVLKLQIDRDGTMTIENAFIPTI